MTTLSVISTILSTFAVFFSIFSFIFFSFLPWKKKNMVNNILKQIRDFYNSYRTLNPSLNNSSNSSKEISKELLDQKIFNYGIPEFDWKKCKNDLTEFDPFDLKSSLYFENLTYLELIRYRHFWNLAKAKLRRVLNVLDKTNYLKNDDNGKLVYNSKYIKASSILIAPDLNDLQKDNSLNIKDHLRKSISKRVKICLREDSFKIILDISISNDQKYLTDIDFKEAKVKGLQIITLASNSESKTNNDLLLDLQKMFNIDFINKQKENYIPLIQK